MKPLKKQVKHQTSTTFSEWRDNKFHLVEDNTTIRIKNMIWFSLSQSIYFDISVGCTFQIFNKIKGDCCVS